MFKKSNWKKDLLLLGLLSLMLVLVACGNDNNNKNDTNNSNTNTSAGDYPSKSISAIVPWGAGSGSDIAFRGYAEYIGKELGTNINVQNVSGGNGAVGWANAAAADNDGYNVSLLTFDVLTNEALGVSDTSFEDFDIINMFTIQGMLLITNAEYGYETLEDFLDAAKEAKVNGKTLTIGTNGDYGLWHQAGMLMSEATDTADAYNFVPFESSAEQVSELLGGHIDATIISPTPALGHIEEGSFIALGTLTEDRLVALPDVPTFIEEGYDVKYESWRALAVPTGTPEDIQKALREAGAAAFDNEDFQEWATETNIDQQYMDSEESTNYLIDLYPKVEEVIDKFGIK